MRLLPLRIGELQENLLQRCFVDRDVGDKVFVLLLKRLDFGEDLGPMQRLFFHDERQPSLLKMVGMIRVSVQGDENCAPRGQNVCHLPHIPLGFCID